MDREVKWKCKVITDGREKEIMMWTGCKIRLF